MSLSSRNAPVASGRRPLRHFAMFARMLAMSCGAAESISSFRIPKPRVYGSGRSCVWANSFTGQTSSGWHIPSLMIVTFTHPASDNASSPGDASHARRQGLQCLLRARSNRRPSDFKRQAYYIKIRTRQNCRVLIFRLLSQTVRRRSRPPSRSSPWRRPSREPSR